MEKVRECGVMLWNDEQHQGRRMGVEAVTYGGSSRDFDGGAPTRGGVCANDWLGGTRLHGRAAARHSEIRLGLLYDVSEKHSETNLQVT